MNFLKAFNKIIVLFYKTDVLSEDAILKWYKESHSSRGWSVFMDQVSRLSIRSLIELGGILLPHTHTHEAINTLHNSQLFNVHLITLHFGGK